MSELVASCLNLVATLHQSHYIIHLMILDFARRFLKFVQSQSVPAVRAELQPLLAPMMCHLYVEMIKGKDSKAATEFIRKFAHIVGPVADLNRPVNEVNGELHDDNESHDANSQDRTTSPRYASSLTRIVFAPIDDDNSIYSKSPPHNAQPDLDYNIDDRKYFMELVQTLSQCLRIEELDAFDITQKFRSSKSEVILSLKAVYAIRRYLETAHVLIMQIFQQWFSVEIQECVNEQSECEEDFDDLYDIDDVSDGVEQNGSEAKHNEVDVDLANCRLDNSHSEIRNLIKHVESEIKTVNGLKKSISVDAALATSTADNIPATKPERKSFSVVQNKYLQNIRASVIRSRKFDQPMRLFNLLNADHQVSGCDIDRDECHLVCGFNESTIKLWQLNQSVIRGRKPFSPMVNRQCEWCLENCESSDEIDSDDDTPTLQPPKRPSVSGLFVRQRPVQQCSAKSSAYTKKEKLRTFYERRHEHNTL